MSSQLSDVMLMREVVELRNRLDALSSSLEIPKTRKQLTANLTLYVRLDGSDSNDGRADTAARAFRTIQKALDVASRDYESTVYYIVVKIQDGTWPITSTLVVRPHAVAALHIIGNETTPTNCVIRLDVDGMWGVLCDHASRGLIYLKGITFGAGGSYAGGNPIVARYGAILWCTKVNLPTAGAGSHFTAAEYARIYINGDYTVSGGAWAHLNADRHCTIEIYPSITITFAGSPSFQRWAIAQRHSSVVHHNTAALSGTVTVSVEKYLAQINASVEGIANMPGAGGSVALGGVAL